MSRSLLALPTRPALSNGLEVQGWRWKSRDYQRGGFADGTRISPTKTSYYLPAPHPLRFPYYLNCHAPYPWYLSYYTICWPQYHQIAPFYPLIYYGPRSWSTPAYVPQPLCLESTIIIIISLKISIITKPEAYLFALNPAAPLYRVHEDVYEYVLYSPSDLDTS